MRYVQSEAPPPAAPFNIEHFLVVPAPLRGTAATRYTIFLDGRQIGEQLSYPSAADCRLHHILGRAIAEHKPARTPHFNNVPTRICRTCRQTKSVRQFYLVDGYHGRRDVDCKTCIDTGRAPRRRT